MEIYFDTSRGIVWTFTSNSMSWMWLVEERARATGQVICSRTCDCERKETLANTLDRDPAVKRLL